MTRKRKDTLRRATGSARRRVVRIGDKLIEGRVVDVLDGTVLLGRDAAGPGDLPAFGELVIFIQGQRVFLHPGQGYLPIVNLSGKRG